MKWPADHGTYGLEDKPFLHQLDHSKDDLTEYEQGSVDYALALSLSDDQKVEYWIGIEKSIKAQVEEDRQIAAAVHESLLLPTSSNESKYETAIKICVGCNSEIIRGLIGNGVVVWHPECFICHDCKRLIKKDDKYYMSENRPYHTFCNRKMGRLKCDVCKNFIPKFNGEVVYSKDPVWEQKYCPSHEQDGTSKCYSCERLEPKDDKHSMLIDGRKLCFECSNFVIMDTNECQPLLKEIQTYFESLQMKVDQKIPLLLVEREALNEAMDGKKNNGDTRGLCVSEEQNMPIEGSLLDMLIKPHRLARNCEVTAILILFGLPRLLTGSLLAHEMMHAWLRLKDYPKLKPVIEEGICQVLAHMWLKSKIKSRSGSDVASSSSSLWGRSSNKSDLTETERKLGECFIRQIELDASSDYGDGFRVGSQAVSHYGLRETLDHIKLAKTFPIISTFVGRDSNL